MDLDGILPVFLCGVLGGFLGELFKWYRLREKKVLPFYATSLFYWGVTSLLILSGGGLCVLYGTKDVNALMAVNIGLSAPLIIQRLSNTYTADRTADGTSVDTKAGEKANTDNIAKYLGVERHPSIWRFLAG